MTLTYETGGMQQHLAVVEGGRCTPFILRVSFSCEYRCAPLVEAVEIRTAPLLPTIGVGEGEKPPAVTCPLLVFPCVCVSVCSCC